MPTAVLTDLYRVTFVVSSLIDPYDGPFYSDVIEVQAVDIEDAAHKAEDWVYNHCRYADRRVEPLVSICQVSLGNEATYG